nr:TPA_asm: 22 kDa protein [Erythranthe ophiovirus]
MDSIFPGHGNSKECVRCSSFNYLTEMKYSPIVMKLDEELEMRNGSRLIRLMSIKLPYKVVTRFLFGSWIVSDKIMGEPLSPKGIIIIESENEIHEMLDVEDYQVFICNNIQVAVNDYTIIATKADIVFQSVLKEIMIIRPGAIKIPKQYILTTNVQNDEINKRWKKINKMIITYKNKMSGKSGHESDIITGSKSV